MTTIILREDSAIGLNLGFRFQFLNAFIPITCNLIVDSPSNGDIKRLVISRFHRAELPENLATAFETPQDNALYAAVFSLPEKYRVVILLYYYEEYSVQEISEMLQRNPSTIQTQLERARKKLKALLEQKGGFHYGQTAIQAAHGTNSDV